MPVEILVGGRQLNCLYVLAESSLRLSSTEAVLRQINWGLVPFTDNPQEENPARGYIVSANYQPLPDSGIKVPGYYNLPARGIRLDQRLANNTCEVERCKIVRHCNWIQAAAMQSAYLSHYYLSYRQPLATMNKS